jgi:hypothetical protein
LEHIPHTYELGEKFFKAPYTSHFYTCRIFRWMVGHFYPQYLRDITQGYSKVILGHSQNNDIDYHRDNY